MRRRFQVLAAVVLAGAGAAGSWAFFAHHHGSADRQALLTETRAASARGDHARAAVLLDSYLARHPTDVDAHLARAQTAHQASDYNGARNGYLEVLRLDPTRSAARAGLFDLTFQAGVRAEAEHHLRKLEALVGATAAEVQSRKQRLSSAPAP